MQIYYTDIGRVYLDRQGRPATVQGQTYSTGEPTVITAGNAGLAHVQESQLSQPGEKARKLTRPG
jgi:hypothetical protein